MNNPLCYNQSHEGIVYLISSFIILEPEEYKQGILLNIEKMSPSIFLTFFHLSKLQTHVILNSEIMNLI